MASDSSDREEVISSYRRITKGRWSFAAPHAAAFGYIPGARSHQMRGGTLPAFYATLTVRTLIPTFSVLRVLRERLGRGAVEPLAYR